MLVRKTPYGSKRLQKQTWHCSRLSENWQGRMWTRKFWKKDSETLSELRRHKLPRPLEWSQCQPRNWDVNERNLRLKKLYPRTWGQLKIEVSDPGSVQKLYGYVRLQLIHCQRRPNSVAERDEFKNRPKKLTFERQCIFVLDSEAQKLLEKGADHKKANAAAKDGCTKCR